MVYVGANDGMLHGFDAGNGATKGQEKLAFIPSAVFSSLHELTKPNYPFNHKFFVDGTPTMGDAFYAGAWHTLLVGGLNKGGQSIYALDITNPGSFDEGNASSIFRWEYTDADLGYTYSRPAIAKMANGRWAAIFGNGYNNSTPGTPAPISTTGRAYLYVVDVETGLQIAKIDTLAGSVGTPNGLATPAVVDINGDPSSTTSTPATFWATCGSSTCRIPTRLQLGVFRTPYERLPAPLYTAKDQLDHASSSADHFETGSRPRSAGPGHGGVIRHRQVHGAGRQGADARRRPSMAVRPEHQYRPT